MDPGRYCRKVESYLCRKNDGHLIRVVGPAFELVYGWAQQEIPIRVVFGGVDRTFERYHAKAGRKRPLRIEFCEADVIKLFDEWRRAVGVSQRDDAVHEGGASRAHSRLSLREHVTRAVELLKHWRSSGHARGLEVTVSRLVGELDELVESAWTARGTARRRLVDRLADCDRRLVSAVRQQMDPTVDAELRREAARELEPYRDRMPPDGFREALVAATEQLLTDRFEVPRIRFE